jgi:hypothetical protein
MMGREKRLIVGAARVLVARVMLRLIGRGGIYFKRLCCNGLHNA